MKRITTVVLALVALCSVALAQGGGQRGGFGQRGFGAQGGPGLLGREDVSTELKLTTEQKGKVQALLESLRPQGGPGGGGGAGGGGQRGGGGQTAGQRAETEAKVKAILDEGQYKRYRELSLQRAGGLGLRQEETAKALGLTESQIGKLEAIQEDMRAEQQDMFQNAGAGGDRQAMMAEFTKLREKYGKTMFAVLTPEQKKLWDTMSGKPFKFVEPPIG